MTAVEVVDPDSRSGFLRGRRHHHHRLRPLLLPLRRRSLFAEQWSAVLGSTRGLRDSIQPHRRPFRPAEEIGDVASKGYLRLPHRQSYQHLQRRPRRPVPESSGMSKGDVSRDLRGPTVQQSALAHTLPQSSTCAPLGNPFAAISMIKCQLGKTKESTVIL